MHPSRGGESLQDLLLPCGAETGEGKAKRKACA